MKSKEEITIQALKDQGYAAMKHYGDEDDNPDAWLVLQIWLGTDKANLYLDYDCVHNNYFFYRYDRKKASKESRPKNVKMWFTYKVKDLLMEAFPYFSLARKIARTVAGKKMYYYTDDPEIVNIASRDVDAFSALVNWLVSNDDNFYIYAVDVNKPYYVCGDMIKIFKKMKRLGYKSYIDEDEIEQLEGFEYHCF